MWIFGYGSLMWDHWEEEFGCTARGVAELHGYQRVFNKASIKNWGTRQCPCPTLNLEAAEDALCVGIAFEFPEDKVAGVRAFLAKREGKNFDLYALEVQVRALGVVHAMVPLYTGKNVLAFPTKDAFATAVTTAFGEVGACSDYLSGVRDHLAGLGIEDPAVATVADILQSGPR